MGMKTDAEVRHVATLMFCDMCKNKEKLVDEHVSGWDRWEEPAPASEHDWIVVPYLPMRREPIADPLVFCSQVCFDAYLDVIRSKNGLTQSGVEATT